MKKKLWFSCFSKKDTEKQCQRGITGYCYGLQNVLNPLLPRLEKESSHAHFFWLEKAQKS